MPIGEILFSQSCTNGELDDTELIESYDKAVAAIKSVVAERIGLNAEDVASATESCSSSRSQTDRRKAKGGRKHKKKHHLRREWAVGDHCQACYSDGIWYEGTVISLNHKTGMCKVQYVGYGNEEDVPISSLKQSMGVAVRRSQQQAATEEQGMDVESEKEENNFRSPGRQSSCEEQTPQPSIGRNVGSPHTASNFSPRSLFAGIPSIPNISKTPTVFHDMVAPPPPPHILSNLPNEEAEALSAMLMSWYMSGFHTGYYQGLKKRTPAQTSDP